MNYRQERMLEAMQSMADTIAAKPELAPFAETTAYKSLTTIIAELAAHASSQQVGTMGSRGETVRYRSLRRALRDIHLEPIVAAARLCTPENPELASLRMPRSRLRVQSLLATTQAIIDTAHVNEQALVGAGLAPTFLAETDAAMRSLRASLDGRAQHGTRRNGATEGLSASERRARQVIKIVNSQVTKLIGPDNAPLLAEWQTAMRIGRKPGAIPGSAAATVSTPGGNEPPPSVATRATRLDPAAA